MDELKHLRARRKLAAAIGLLAYLVFLGFMVLSANGDGRHLGAGRNSLWSDWGIAATLLIASPVVFYAVWREFRRK